MECFEIRDLSFAYPTKKENTLDGIDLTVGNGEFTVICGKSGCGKTTLLRLLKSSLAPFGKISGEILFCGRPLSEYSAKEQATKIGFVLQNPDNQIVTDKVWHELAFGLESLGYTTAEIRARVAEMASFFGIDTWFHKNVTELSGGQKQLLNLASVMVMQPSVLILDEPTSQLDPIAADEFLKTVEKINRELGTAVILTEHRLEDALPMADRVVVMDNGRIIANDSPEKIGDILRESSHDMFLALPTPMKVHYALGGGKCPLTVRDAKAYLEEYAKNNPLYPERIEKAYSKRSSDKIVVSLNDVWFRYEKDSPDVIKGLNMEIRKGEFYAIVGGNGTGKTTALTLMAGINKAYRGKVLIKDRDAAKDKGICGNILSLLPQDPQTLFTAKTVYKDLSEILAEKELSSDEKEKRIKDIASLCRIEGLLESHPYDLSGGEQQRAALAKVLLTDPEILLLDEPTKGMDAGFKEEFADIISDLKSLGVTVIAVSHDIEFCAAYADRCAMFFDGEVTSEGAPREFFAGKSFYTTSANRMARSVLPNAVLAEDIIKGFGKTVPQKPERTFVLTSPSPKKDNDTSKGGTKFGRKLSFARIIAGVIFVLLFIAVCIFKAFKDGIPLPEQVRSFDINVIYILAVIFAAGALLCFFPGAGKGFGTLPAKFSSGMQRLNTAIAAIIVLAIIPLTIYWGMRLFGDRKYYLISFLVIIETIIPFFLLFEKRKPKARELVTISVMCAIAVAGRAAFFMLPQFKPVLALIIIAGISFGGQTGFLVGAITGLVSNFFFGQGPWTPWQMFALGIVGFLAGVLFRILPKNKLSLCIFGFASTLAVYGIIMNSAHVLMVQSEPTFEMIAAYILTGLPFDIIHASATAFFLWVMAEPMTDKLERVKLKYGLMDR